jgi:phosphoglycerol transferase MdoB-like AlkP superfamily enzyme
VGLNYLQQLSVLLKRLSISYLLYFICRLLFYFANRSYFPVTGFGDLLLNCFYGLRFDTFSIIVSNSLFILLSLLPINLFYRPGYQQLLKWLFYIPNLVFTIANCIDIGYFPFIRKRSNADLFEQIGGQSDLIKLLPQFARDFWWIPLAFAGMVLGMAFLYKRVAVRRLQAYTFSKPLQWAGIVLIFLVATGLSVIGARGGLQRVPIDIVNAGSMTRAEEIPLVLNTPFTLIKSLDHQAIEELNYYPPAELQALYNPIHQFRDSVFKPMNVVVIILESFAKEYTSLAGPHSLTPFLDSLMGHSLVFTNAFSNGSKSIEGIPAILSGLPTLMENPFINSIYANNRQSSLAALLKAEGYHTAFFHGGINGTMNFDDWAPLAGYDAYYGKDEYSNDEDFDKFWGIWDEPFLQYSIKKMDDFKQPFHTAIFTLSSHHPYFVPKRYQGKFPKGKYDNAESIGYADHALRKFFQTAAKSPWYNNTLFVLTADHASLSEHPFYSNVVGNQSIPILFFRPNHSLTGKNSSIFSQMDIVPSTLRLLGYNKPFFAFGEAFGQNKNPASYFYSSGTHYIFNDSMLYIYTNNRMDRAFNYKRDSTLSMNILNNAPLLDSLASRRFRAFLQTYNHTLIHNTGAVK